MYLSYLLWDAKKSKALSSETIEESEEIKNLSIPKAIFSTIIGLVLIIAGSNCVVEGATFIAEKAGLSERFIGLTIVALGTSLPELVTSVIASKKNEDDIAIRNYYQGQWKPILQKFITEYTDNNYLKIIFGCATDVAVTPINSSKYAEHMMSRMINNKMLSIMLMIAVIGIIINILFAFITNHIFTTFHQIFFKL